MTGLCTNSRAILARLPWNDALQNNCNKPVKRLQELIANIRHSRAPEVGSPVELASVFKMTLDSRLRGNDEDCDGMENIFLNAQYSLSGHLGWNFDELFPCNELTAIPANFPLCFPFFKLSSRRASFASISSRDRQWGCCTSLISCN